MIAFLAAALALAVFLAAEPIAERLIRWISVPLWRDRARPLALVAAYAFALWLASHGIWYFG